MPPHWERARRRTAARAPAHRRARETRWWYGSWDLEDRDAGRLAGDRDAGDTRPHREVDDIHGAGIYPDGLLRYERPTPIGGIGHAVRERLRRRDLDHFGQALRIDQRHTLRLLVGHDHPPAVGRGLDVVRARAHRDLLHQLERSGIEHLERVAVIARDVQPAAVRSAPAERGHGAVPR